MQERTKNIKNDNMITKLERRQRDEKHSEGVKLKRYLDVAKGLEFRDQKQ